MLPGELPPLAPHARARIDSVAYFLCIHFELRACAYLVKNQPFYEVSSVPTARLCPRYIRSFLCFVQVKHGVGVRRGLRAANHSGGKFLLTALLTDFQVSANLLKKFLIY